MLLKICLLTTLVSSSAQADYTLVTTDRYSDTQSVEPYFETYEDCRERGLKNQSLVSMFNGRAGFKCINMEE